MSRAGRCLLVLLCSIAWPVQALELTLPVNASETASRDQTLAQQAVPTASFTDGAVPARIFEGPVIQRAYRIASSGLTPLQILAPLRAQIEAAGYEILLDCDEDRCGGFDFRFGIDVLPAPNMYVNIRAYHFLSAVAPDDTAAVTLLASAAAGAGYVQIVQVGAATVGEPQSVQGDDDQPPTATQPTTDLTAKLLANGHAVLQTLDFAVGTTTLSAAESPELAAIAATLRARPGLRIAVVGHTDTVGGLDANIAVSRARAQSVRRALINDYGVPADRIEANGMGYLAPVATNLTAEGREANRRVEVVIVSEDN
ncbi:OmpA family protein [Tateyamaria armeniaca]|uniref:OmpA family protein n=1 Tax=Tateyamaria armeniaca TaxID=2518930 RepID=A0ABW8US19_9RHOB